jgi:selenocysteine lyase/cysteine desulfurase
VSFALKNQAAAKAKLEKAKVVVTLNGYMRVSLSVFNNMQDIDRLLEALS